MERKFYTWILIILGFAVTPETLQSQDIHFSQFGNSPHNLSPALTGVYSGDVRFIGNFRNQWQSVPVPYMTFSGAYDRKFFLKGLTNSFFAGALLFNYDQSGTSELSLTNLSFNGAYTIQLSKSFFLSGGAQLGIGQRAFDFSALSFDNQFDGEQYIQDLPTRENFEDTNVFFTDLSAGLNFRIQHPRANLKTKRTKIDIGGSVYHINNPSVGFYEDDDISLGSRLNVYMLSTLMLTENFDVLLNGTAQFQGEYRENVVGAAGKIHLSRKKAKELAVQLGAAYRFYDFGDAVIPNIELHIRQWQVGVSYDVNISEFQEATNRNGGLEVSVQYIIQKVKPLPQLKICPII